MEPYGPYRHMPLDTTTQWEKSTISAETAKHVPTGYAIWNRLMNGEHFWACLPIGVEPTNGLTMGYHGIAEAIEAAKNVKLHDYGRRSNNAD